MADGSCGRVNMNELIINASPSNLNSGRIRALYTSHTRGGGGEGIGVAAQTQMAYGGAEGDKGDDGGRRPEARKGPARSGGG
jgi:hypothetical protein